MSRPSRYWPWVAALVVVLVTAGILVFDRDDAQQAHPGQVVQSDYEKTYPYTTYVDLPPGRVTVRLTKAMTSVHDDDTMDGREAPDDGSFVGVSTQLTTQRAVPQLASARSPELTIALVVGSHHYLVPSDPLSGPDYSTGPDASRDAWVAVPGTPQDVQVAITYGSLEQTVTPQTGKRSAGVAAALAALPPANGAVDAATCGAASITPRTFTGDPDRRPQCHYATVRVPYVGGLGWAKNGRIWLVCNVDADQSALLRYGKQVYRSVSGPASDVLTLDGRKSLGDPDSNVLTPVTGYPDGVFVGIFDVPSGGHGTIGAAVTFRDLAPAESRHVAGTPDSPTVTITWKVRV